MTTKPFNVLTSYTPEQYRTVLAAIHATWNAIAPDVLAYTEPTNEEIIDICIDANNLLLNGGSEEADNLVWALTREALHRMKLQLLKDVRYA